MLHFLVLQDKFQFRRPSSLIRQYALTLPNSI